MDRDLRSDDYRRPWRGLVVGLLICLPLWLIMGYAVAESVS